MKRLRGIFLVLALLMSMLPGRVPTISAEGGVIASGQTVSGNIARSGQRDNWTFAGNQGDRVIIRMNARSGSGLDPYLELIAPSGTRETYNDDGGGGLNSLINNWQLRESGTYTIVARGYGSSTGAYTLSFSLIPGGSQPQPPTPTPTPTPTRSPQVGDESGPISSGRTVSGYIGRSGERDDWPFRGSRGDRVTIRLNKASGSGLDPYLELVAPSGARETYNDDGGGYPNSLISNWELRESGTYTIVASGWLGSSTGAYTLSFSLIPDGGPPPQPTPPLVAAWSYHPLSTGG